MTIIFSIDGKRALFIGLVAVGAYYAIENMSKRIYKKGFEDGQKAEENT